MLVLGIDIGTSGVRTAVLDADGALVSTARADHGPTSNTDAQAWWDAVVRTLDVQIDNLRSLNINPHLIKRIAIDGTSGSMVLVDEALNPVSPALMYNSSGFVEEAVGIERHAEPTSITRGASSALARMLRLQSFDVDNEARHLLHQADYVLAKLGGTALGSDDNNALKLGWDPKNQSWPSWFDAAGVHTSLLPSVRRAGAPVGEIGAGVAQRLGLASDVQLHAGTTDSIAAFLASGASEVGDAVTSLGTTLAVKLLSDTRVDDPASGIYSHLLQGMWLAGGASNTGGGVLASLFSAQELEALSAQIDPSIVSPLDYYPLTKPGERFPVNDPDLMPRMGPRPASDVDYLHGLLESITRIEAHGYAKLEGLGAPSVKRVFTAGGGAKNPVWTAIRQRHLGVPFVEAQASEACIGAALMCLNAGS